MTDSYMKTDSIQENVSDHDYADKLLSRIRQELSDAENHYIVSNAHWEERFYDVEILAGKDKSYEYKDLLDNDLGYNFNKIYRPNMGNKIDVELRKYYPLRMFYFDDQKAICNVYGIFWDNIATKRSRRDLYVRNDGLFVLNKYGRTVSYKLKYDVKDDSYSFSIKRHNEYDFIDYSHSNDCISKSFNNVSFLYNLSDDSKVITLKDHNPVYNHSTTYSLFYDKDNKLSKVRILTDIIKDNGRTGHYFLLDVTKESINSYYINRKGIKKELDQSKDKGFEFAYFINRYYKDTLDNENEPFRNLKLYILEKAQEALEGFTIGDEDMNPEVKNAMVTIDGNITQYFGEIPFPSLDEKMRNDINFTREKILGKVNAFIKSSSN